MTKKIIALLIGIVTAAAFVLAGCGSGGSTPEKPAEQKGSAAAQPAAASADELIFEFNGVKIPMKVNAAPILEALGEAKSYNEETSCAFEGLDKSYFYGSYYLYTYPQGDEDYVNMIEIVDDTVETPEGLSIGDSKEKVEELYGADSFNGTNAYIINSKDCTLTIILDNDKVSSIQYAAVFE